MRGSATTTRVVGTATILVSANALDGSLVRGWRRVRRAGRLLAVCQLVPLLHPLVDSRWHSIAAPALVAPSAAPVPATKEGKPEQEQQAEHDEQEPEEAEDPEAPAEGVRPVAVVVGRRGDGTGRDLGRQAVRPSHLVSDDSNDRQHDPCHHQSEQTESAPHENLSLK